jgi:polysaccharide pyruvyl transferase CsaB
VSAEWAARFRADRITYQDEALAIVEWENLTSTVPTSGGIAPRIVISGWYGHNNIGDDAILDVLVAELGRRLRSCSFTVLTEAVSSPQVGSLRGYAVRWLPHRSPYRVCNARNPWLWSGYLRCWEAVGTCDLFILGGGGLLRDNFPRSNLLRLLDDVLCSRITGRPVALFALGVGPFVTATGRRLARSAVALATSVSVRDEVSATALRSIDVPEGRFRVIGDPALLLAAGPPAALPQRDGQLQVAICPCQGMLTGFRGGEAGNPRLLEILARAADGIAETLGARIWLIPFCRVSENDNDVTLCRGIRERMARSNNATLVTDVLDAPQTKALLGRMNVVVGARLHSLILAAAGGVPCVGINYEPKVRGFMQEAGLEDYCLDPLQVTPEGIVRLVCDGAERGGHLSQVIASRIAAARARTKEVLDRLAELASSHVSRRMGRVSLGSEPSALHQGVTR